MSDSGGGKRFEVVAAAGLCLLAILGLIALIYAVGLLNGEQSERRQNNPHAYSQTAKQKAERACIGAEPKAVFECVVGYVEASEDKAYTEQDLTAQQRAAWGALVAAFAGLASVVVSFVGLYWIKGTLDATRVAADQARIATNAMVDANEIARSANRPIMVFDGYHLETVMPGTSAPNSGAMTMFIHPRWINMGTLPATVTASHVRRTYVNGTPSDDMVNEFRKSENVIHGRTGKVINKGEPYVGPAFSVMVDELSIIHTPDAPHGYRNIPKLHPLVAATLKYKVAVGESDEWESEQVFGIRVNVDEDGWMRQDVSTVHPVITRMT